LENFERKVKDLTDKNSFLQDRNADLQLELNQIRNANRLHESEIEQLKKNFIKESTLRKEIESTLDQIQSEALAQNTRYSEEMHNIKAKIETFKRNEHDLKTRAGNCESEKNQLLSVINNMQGDYMGRNHRFEEEFKIKTEEVTKVLEALSKQEGKNQLL